MLKQFKAKIVSIVGYSGINLDLLYCANARTKKEAMEQIASEVKKTYPNAEHIILRMVQPEEIAEH